MAMRGAALAADLAAFGFETFFAAFFAVFFTVVFAVFFAVFFADFRAAERLAVFGLRALVFLLALFFARFAADFDFFARFFALDACRRLAMVNLLKSTIQSIRVAGPRTGCNAGRARWFRCALS
jgi:hypothetical protein